MIYDNSVCKGYACKSGERKDKCLICKKKMCKNCGVNKICINCLAFILEKQTFFPMVYATPDGVKPTPEKDIKVNVNEKTK